MWNCCAIKKSCHLLRLLKSNVRGSQVGLVDLIRYCKGSCIYCIYFISCIIVSFWVLAHMAWLWVSSLFFSSSIDANETLTIHDPRKTLSRIYFALQVASQNHHPPECTHEKLKKVKVSKTNEQVNGSGIWSCKVSWFWRVKQWGPRALVTKPEFF